MPNENDAEYALTVAAQAGDLGALARLIEAVRAPLFALAYAKTSSYDDAQDAVASGILRACRSIHQLQKPGAFRPWLVRIVRNEAHRIREKRLLSAPVEENLPDTNGPNETSGVIFRVDVETALRALPRDQARAVALLSPWLAHFRYCRPTVAPRRNRQILAAPGPTGAFP